jgi:prepilin-type N-terminal cleavage/methylation domain-containing protein
MSRKARRLSCLVGRPGLTLVEVMTVIAVLALGLSGAPHRIAL